MPYRKWGEFLEHVCDHFMKAMEIPIKSGNNAFRDDRLDYICTVVVCISHAIECETPNDEYSDRFAYIQQVIAVHFAKFHHVYASGDWRCTDDG